ncbi:MAG: hypothetical protein ACI8WB_005957 [Phenylobacterium sp.]|jgi:hypothetical protein
MWGKALCRSITAFVPTRDLWGYDLTYKLSKLNQQATQQVTQQNKGSHMIKMLSNTPIKAKHTLSCHCGQVELLLDLPDGIVDPRRCDCSICRRKGAIAASVPLSGLTVVKGQDVLKLYQFNTNAAKHYFCSNCGIYTHHQRRSNPEQYGYNVGCLEGVNPFDLGEIVTNDGVNHPADR